MSLGWIQFSGNVAADVIRDDISISRRLGRPLTGNQKSFLNYNYGRDMRMTVSDITLHTKVVPENIGLPESEKGAISTKVA